MPRAMVLIAIPVHIRTLVPVANSVTSCSRVPSVLHITRNFALSDLSVESRIVTIESKKHTWRTYFKRVLWSRLLFYMNMRKYYQGAEWRWSQMQSRTYRKQGRFLQEYIMGLPSSDALISPTAVISFPTGSIFSSSKSPTCMVKHFH